MTAEPRYERGDEPEASGWAIGGVVFAGSVMIMIGIFQAIAGLVAIFNDEFYVVSSAYTFDLDVSAWGWIHLIIGALVAIVGFSLLSRRAWAGVATIAFAMLSAITNFFFIPYYPVWSIVLIALNVWVIWAITQPGAIRT